MTTTQVQTVRPNFYEVLHREASHSLVMILGVPAVCIQQNKGKVDVSYRIKFIDSLINKGLESSTLEKAVSNLVRDLWDVDLEDKSNNYVVLSHPLGTARENRAKPDFQLTQEIRAEEKLMGKFRSTGDVLTGGKKDLDNLVFRDFLYGW